MEKHEWEIEWSATLNVGVAEIDEEHRQFVARVNELNKAIVECEDKPTVKWLLQVMLTEAKHHFWHEQRLLALWKYPDRAVHVAKHVLLTAKLNSVMQEFEQADVSFTWALKGLYLKQLLVDHLMKEDMKYRDFLRRRKGANPIQHRSHSAREPALVPA